MSEVIRVEGLGKEYILGGAEESGQTFREMLVGAFKSPFRKLRHLAGSNQELERFWALKDVNFSVNHGEIVGIIGRNGAGKSTLLKVLSRITEPTKGRVITRGRIASLLEVGTGFHPELTGRENIYLNGAILGMSRREITQKFDEIVAFAEVEQFLDTPVKRFSSGMYVRLAFSVAAHLEPEILLVDEVLAVGDSTFQRKCLGKMEDVAQTGRTVLFVSHNMASISQLCTRGIVLENGSYKFDGRIEDAIDCYLNDDLSEAAQVTWPSETAPQSSEVRLISAQIQNEGNSNVVSIDSKKGFEIVVDYEVLIETTGVRIGFLMQNEQGINICGSTDYDVRSDQNNLPGRYRSRCLFPADILNAGRYSIRIGVDLPPYMTPLITTPFCLAFDVDDLEGHGPYKYKLPGILKPSLNWQVEKNSN